VIGAIVLAAGMSRRMGTQKLLLPFAGTTLIRHVVGQVVAGPVGGTVVVVADAAGPVAGAVSELPVRLVTNPQPDADMLSSVRCGLRALPPECDAVLVAPGDHPAVTPDLIRRMSDQYVAHGADIVVPVFRGRRGHPLLFSSRFVGEILTGYDGVGLRGLLDAHPTEVVELAVADEGVVQDVDVPEDYRRALERIAAE
jgi:molybdenum cofactor cytidylyltransferase